MAKFHDMIGFVKTEETEPGLWEPVTEEKLYSGEVSQTTARWEDNGRINANLEINHTISVILDSYITQNMFALRYVCYAGRRWNVSKISVLPPRMILTLGSEYYKEDHDDRVTSDQSAARCFEA